MPNKNERHTPSPTLQSSQNASKLPKFLQKQVNRDRSKSVTEPFASTASIASASSLSTSSDITPSSSAKPRKSSKFSIIRDKEDKKRRSSEAVIPLPPVPFPYGSHDSESSMTTVDEAPVIVEPVAIPRPKRPDRSTNSPTDSAQSLYAPTSSTSRISDLPTRLSGWFAHAFSPSTADLSLPSLLSQSASSSPNRAAHASALLTAAKHGKGHLDKAMRYLLDSDATPDKCKEPIWLLGVQHPGYEPPPSPPLMSSSISLSSSTSSFRRNSISLRSSTSSLAGTDLVKVNATSSKGLNPAANWPPVFYADFTSRIWLTYRSQFAPIRDVRLADLSTDPSDGQVVSSPTTVKSKPWNWGGREKGWTSDSGWGCMLRTGQSLLANALIHVHLGRDWRKPPQAVHTADFATYVQILTWFFDTPSPEAPFSVHRMALAGKELGKDVGQWFGPSTAAGAIKTLVNNFPDGGLGVSVATDGVLFQTDVFTASHTGSGHIRSTRRHQKSMSTTWGDCPVLLLIGLRLGLDGVNPVYYDTIKTLYTFPQSVGIAGGRPSSSYYFVGSQAENLFYLDPHHARPAIPLRPAPPHTQEDRPTSPEEEFTRVNQRSPPPHGYSHHQRVPTSPSSVRTGASSTFSYHAPLSPSPLQQEFSQSSSSATSSESNEESPSRARPGRPYSRSPPPVVHHTRWRSSSQSQNHGQPASPVPDIMLERELTGLDAAQEHYVTAYHPAELITFHCERVRKMPLSGLDPSMLLGFLCKNEADWWDFRRRVGDLSRMIFSVQDEPPTWPSDSDEYMGLESISEPDDVDMDLEDEDDHDHDIDIERDDIDCDDGGDDGDGEEQFFETRSASLSTSSASASGSRGHTSDRSSKRKAEDGDVDTEDDPVDPITPGPHARFSISQQLPQGQSSEEDARGSDEIFDGGDIDDDWIDPSIPSSPRRGVSEDQSDVSASHIHPVKGSGDLRNRVVPSSSAILGTSSSKKKGKSKKKEREHAVPVPLLIGSSQEQHYPFPVAEEGPSPEPQDRSRSSSATSKGVGFTSKRMHTARARDGGRTQSGGVKGILTEN